MDGKDGRKLLRKKDLVDLLGMPKSTVSDWIADFHAFIPTVKEGSVTYYKPEAIDVLNAIKAMREQNWAKAEIYAQLQERGFPITVEEGVDDVQKALVRADARKALLDVMQQVGTALERIADQEDAIEYIEKRQNALSDRQDGQDGRMTELERTVMQLKAELDSARSEIATTKAELERVQEEAKAKEKRSWWPFGRRK